MTKRTPIHMSFSADAGDLQHIRTLHGLRNHLASLCAELNRRIDAAANGNSGGSTDPAYLPADHWVMYELVALHERTKELIAETWAPTEHPIPAMRWSPRGHIVAHQFRDGQSCWYDPYGDPWTVYTDDEVADWPCLGRVPDPTGDDAR